MEKSLLLTVFAVLAALSCWARHPLYDYDSTRVVPNYTLPAHVANAHPARLHRAVFDKYYLLGKLTLFDTPTVVKKVRRNRKHLPQLSAEVEEDIDLFHRQLEPSAAVTVGKDTLNSYPPSFSTRLPYVLERSATSFPIPADVFAWVERDKMSEELVRRARQSFFVKHPQQVKYVADMLPEPPRNFVASIDPETAKIVITEQKSDISLGQDMMLKVQKRHWPKVFQSSLQFSQAYISPNWYQGGNNNMNALLNLYYNVKLNQAFHPAWLLETTVQYKLGVNNAPDDKLRDYNISEDLFQWNFMAGFKAARRWYYSTNIAFKTQLLKSYKSNSEDLKASFLSPGELNVGLGMTYSYPNKKKTFQFDLSLSPLSWNLKTCINSRVDHESFGLRQSRNTLVNYGSNVEAKVTWQIAYNIKLLSRWFLFTNYEYVQTDWENTIQFAVNRYLTTQIYVHARYDTTTPQIADCEWHKFQLKEILSFGIAYNFSSI